MKAVNYNPDILNCIANLSNDEVFTPPSVVNQMLDLLPEELWHNPKATFLDPFTKSGVFLREITKRLNEGLKDLIPDTQERINHILQKQVFGIAITELTSLLARRSVYCCKTANSERSVATCFADEQGNIIYERVKHSFINGKCEFCGANKDTYANKDGKENYAYQFIHTYDPKKFFKNMKFDVIIGNPPYQQKVNEAGKGLGAIPLYQKFVSQALKLKSRYLCMIIPARWFTGGVGLDEFRNMMLNDEHIKVIVDYPNSRDCFESVDINGGICYFMRDESYKGLCNFTTISNNMKETCMRKLNEFDIFIRQTKALSIVHKVINREGKTFADKGGCSSQTPYGFISNFNGTSIRQNENDCEILSSRGWSYVSIDAVRKMTKNKDLFASVSMYKTMFSKLSHEHAGNPNKDGSFRILSRMEILKPFQICTQSYLIACPSKDKTYTLNVFNYLRTKFVRFLILQTLSGMNLSTANFKFVPMQDFQKPWTDEELYKKYDLNQEEIDFIESMIKPME
ncbi:MAG: Eco57I restriction-modification methylase domain-containing protein [Bacteroidales bacterium]|nr:Eco57I restriction-modification methylase domain-containing protein [Bacteroidales bacterium]